MQATLLVIDRASGEPLAVLDGEALTLRRTAATSALAALRLARSDARTLLVVGTGRLAGVDGARARRVAARPAAGAASGAGDPKPPQALARTLAGEGLPAEAASELEAATRAGACIVCCATTRDRAAGAGRMARARHAPGPGRRLPPHMREVDDAAVARARIVVDTYAGALAEAGDLVQPLAARRDRPRAHRGRAGASCCAARCRVARDAGEITLFKSVGTALEDLAAAQAVIEAGAA